MTSVTTSSVRNNFAANDDQNILNVKYALACFSGAGSGLHFYDAETARKAKRVRYDMREDDGRKFCLILRGGQLTSTSIEMKSWVILFEVRLFELLVSECQTARRDLSQKFNHGFRMGG